MKTVAIAYLALVALLSVVTFATYGFDKRRARLGGRRVPEETLQLLSVFGGWPGALLAQQLFRHKTRKVGFQLVYWLGVVLHLTVVGGVFYLLRIRR